MIEEMSDTYTHQSIDWLNHRFRQTDNSGIYFAHQPIYGFRAGHSEMGLTVRYIRSYQILKALSHFQFDSFLDVGGAEGYKSFIVKNFFNTQIVSSDLSVEANQRAQEIFKIPTKQADVHDLPFKNEEFDIVLCSETLEHVQNYQRGLEELLRVAKKAVILTLPHEKTIDKKYKFGHIHTFNQNSFKYLTDKYKIIYQKMISPLLYGPAFLLEAQKIATLEKTPKNLHEFLPYEYQNNIKKIRPFLGIYNFFTPFLRKLMGPKFFAKILKLDELICRITPWHKAHLFIIIKNQQSYQKKSQLKIDPLKLINLKVPLHYLDQNISES